MVRIRPLKTIPHGSYRDGHSLNAFDLADLRRRVDEGFLTEADLERLYIERRSLRILNEEDLQDLGASISKPTRQPDSLKKEKTRQPDVSNLESETTFTNQRQEADAGGSLDLPTSHPQEADEALSQLCVKIQPALSSLLRDLADWNADERKSQEKSVQKKEKEAIKSTEGEGVKSTETNETIEREKTEGEGVKSTETNETIERGKRFDYLNIYLPLYQAGLGGNWEVTKGILKKYPDAIRAHISEDNQNILHIATLAKRSTYVEELLKLMSLEDLEMKDKDGNTALYYAALSGIVKIAEKMVNKNNKLLLIHGKGEILPLQLASILQNREMVSYLLRVTPFEQLTATDRINLLHQTISAELYDIALKILTMDSTLATAEDNGHIALELLAHKPFAVGSGSQMSKWQICLNSWYKEDRNKAVMPRLAHKLTEEISKNIQQLPNKQFLDLVDKHTSLLFVAAKLGNTEFLTILLRSHPDLIWKIDEQQRNLFHISVLYRQKSVFNLIYEIGALKDMIALCVDVNNNNMLHFAGQLALMNRLKIVSGAVLQMQRELLWFKEIEKIMPPTYLHLENSEGQTPRDIFIKTHRDLLKDGETWMKETTNYCMLVATLIVTVVFAAAFTVPGGNYQDNGSTIPSVNHRENGTPNFLESKWFTVFFISDAIALLSSSTSILIFLSSILTSRYKDEDFLKPLPSRLVFGLIALFISIVGMVVAFSATCILGYKYKTTRIPFAIIIPAGFPIVLFVWLIYDLLFDVIRSTYQSRSLFGRRKHGLFQQIEEAVQTPTIDP